MERLLEHVLFASRWLLVPLYLGLGLFLLIIVVEFFRELLHVGMTLHEVGQVEVVLLGLALVDLVLVASLIVMVMLSGYENFVSRIDVGDRDKPQWMAKVDFGGLKQKLMTSIVAISAIQVLKAFMNLDKMADASILAWLVGIHVVFLGSLLVLAIVDRLEALSGGKGEAKQP
jgi:uncharacterized protein (TIGR00645 family)